MPITPVIKHKQRPAKPRQPASGEARQDGLAGRRGWPRRAGFTP